MKTYLVDSDVLIDFFKKRPEAVALIEELGEQGETVISAISIAELRSGWIKEEAATYLPRLYDIFEVVPVTRNIAEAAGGYREFYSKKGVTLPTMDALIAATAIIDEYCLVTRNIIHYPMPELDLYPEFYGTE